MNTTDDRVESTYQSLRMLGEHVLSASRYAATGRIGLSVVDNGIATPRFGDENRLVGVIDGRLVVSDLSGRREARITTLRAAAQFVGIAAGAPSAVYRPSTHCDLDAPLVVDEQAFAELIGWYRTVATALQDFASAADADEAVTITLWPEHFDVAIRLGEVNYGGLAGDDYCATPYAYVGPDPKLLSTRGDGFWAAPFGAARTRDEVASVSDLLSFFE